MDVKKKIIELKKALQAIVGVGKETQAKGNDISQYAAEALDHLGLVEKKTDLTIADTELITAYYDRCAKVAPQFTERLSLYHSNMAALATVTATYSTGTCTPIMVNQGLEKIFTKGADPSGVIPLRNLHRQELDNYLDAFCIEFNVSKELKELKNAAWSALYSSIPQNANLASHPMRIVFDDVIRILAPTEKVQECDWWQKDQTAAGRVTPEQRIKYLIEGFDMSGTVDQICESFNRYFDTAKQTAHGHRINEQEAKNCLLMLENALLAIFRARKAKYDITGSK